MDLKDIERSIIKAYKSKIYAKFLRAIKEYSLVKDGDSICVCISGGKDSFLMAKCFQELKRHSKFNFDVKYIVSLPSCVEHLCNLLMIADVSKSICSVIFAFPSSLVGIQTFPGSFPLGL